MKYYILTAWLLGLLCVLPARAQQSVRYTQYIEKYRALAIEQMQRYHIPASITLAQGLFESGAGQGELALRSNNHFGIKCGGDWTGPTVRHDDDARQECFRAYDNPRDSYEDHSKFLRGRSRYAFLFRLNIHDYKGWAHGLKKAGYATNPKYAYRLINLIEQYKLYQYDDESLQVQWTQNDEGELMPNDNFTSGGRKEKLGTQFRELYYCNDVPFIFARQGDSLLSLAEMLGMSVSKLVKYNDVFPGYEIREGDRIYLERKRKHASVEDGYIHVLQPGESMHSIAQLLGVRLKNLYKLNKMKAHDALPPVGTILRIH